MFLPRASVIPHRSDTKHISGECEKLNCTACGTACWAMFGPSCGVVGRKLRAMVRKCVVKVVLSREQREILTELSTRLGTSESESMRLALMDYVKELRFDVGVAASGQKTVWRWRKTG